MPYSSIHDLPEAVRKAHPTPHSRRIFLEAFNHAAASGKYDEATQFKIAHAAADRVTARKRQAAPKAPKVEAAPAASIDDHAEMRRYVNSPRF